jgi:hypothetical protein
VSILELQYYGQNTDVVSFRFQADMDLLKFYRSGVHERLDALIASSHLEITISPREVPSPLNGPALLRNGFAIRSVFCNLLTILPVTFDDLLDTDYYLHFHVALYHNAKHRNQLTHRSSI